MARTEFTDEELKSPLFVQVVQHPDGPHGKNFVEFHGFITDRVLSKLKLDDIDQQIILQAHHRDMADWLQSLEIIFRRWAQQHPKS